MAKLNGINLETPIAPGSGSGDIAFSIIKSSLTGSLFTITGDGATTISGSLTVTGSLTAGSFTGSITGTASYATQALSASFATTASYVTGSIFTNGNRALSASFAISTAAVAGTLNYIPKFATSTTLGNSVIYESGSNIGIGTSTPMEKIDVSGNIRTTNGFISDNSTLASLSLKISGTETGRLDNFNSALRLINFHASSTTIIQGNGDVGINTVGGNVITLGTSNTERMRITSSGNVGIGTTSPTAKLHVVAPGALSSDIGFKVRNSANTADLFNVVGTGQVSVFNNSTNSSLSSMDPTNTFAAVTLENFSLVNTTFKKVLGIQSYAGSGIRYLTMSNLDDLHWNHRFTVAGRLTATAGIACTSVSNDFNSSTIVNLYGVNLISQASVSMRPDFNLALTENNLGLFIAPNNTLNPTKKLIKLMDSTLTTTYFTVNGSGQVGIGTSSPTKTLQVVGTTFLSSSFNTAASGSTLTVYGSGSAQPVFTVQGSQGELFSITDSLSGSLFSVNDISGLPIMEVFSDNTTLMGSYQDPMLITTTKVTQTNSGSFTVYSLPTASYDTAFFEYSIRSGSNARAGSIMAIQLGSTVNFTETTTTDFGNTSAVSFTVIVTGSNMALTGSSTSGAWTIKTIVRGI